MSCRTDDGEVGHVLQERHAQPGGLVAPGAERQARVDHDRRPSGRHRGILFAEQADANSLALTHVQRAAAEGRSEIETWYVRKDGRTIWVNLSGTVLRDEAGRPLHTTAVIQDITRRREAEEALRRMTEIGVPGEG